KVLSLIDDDSIEAEIGVVADRLHKGLGKKVVEHRLVPVRGQFDASLLCEGSTKRMETGYHEAFISLTDRSKMGGKRRVVACQKRSSPISGRSCGLFNGQHGLS